MKLFGRSITMTFLSYITLINFIPVTTLAEEILLSREMVKGNNVSLYLNVWAIQMGASKFKNKLIKTNDKPILLNEEIPTMHFPLETKEFNSGVNYFVLESISDDGKCNIPCDFIIIFGEGKADIKSARKLCKQKVKRQFINYGRIGSCNGSNSF